MKHRLAALALAVLGHATQARACDLALLLAVDVSGSVDNREYRVQMDGLAAALRDGVVSEALIQARAQVALVQWTGTSRQITAIPWQSVGMLEDVRALADRIEAAPREWRNFSTAIGEALAHSLGEMAAMPDCRRKVIDISGDGVSNEGTDPATQHAALRDAGITVNALVIETDETDLTGYFWENVITGSGAFVVTANGFEDYPRRIRQKLIRETSKQLAAILPAPDSRGGPSDH